MKKIINAKLAAIKSGNLQDFEIAEKKEIDFLASQDVYQFTSDIKNVIVQEEAKYQKLCRALEMEGMSIKGMTVIEFESAISLITARAEKAKQQAT